MDTRANFSFPLKKPAEPMQSPPEKRVEFSKLTGSTYPRRTEYSTDYDSERRYGNSPSIQKIDSAFPRQSARFSQPLQSSLKQRQAPGAKGGQMPPQERFRESTWKERMD